VPCEDDAHSWQHIHLHGHCKADDQSGAGNLIIWQLLQDNIVASPNLNPAKGQPSLRASSGPGFELDPTAVDRAAELFRAEQAD
jgi:hypothetical protein